MRGSPTLEHVFLVGEDPIRPGVVLNSPPERAHQMEGSPTNIVGNLIGSIGDGAICIVQGLVEVTDRLEKFSPPEDGRASNGKIRMTDQLTQLSKHSRNVALTLVGFETDN